MAASGEYDFIIIDGWTNEWLRETAAQGEAAGYLQSRVHQGQQYTAVVYRLTDAGRKALEDRTDGGQGGAP